MSWIKRNGRLLACLSLLFLSASGAAVLFSESAAVAAASWGLSFRTEGQPPLADVSPDALKPYDAAWLGSSDEKVLYLTFDAGYENGCTAQILDTLKAHHAPAAFFLVGNYLERNPDLVRRMADEGHLVGNHTWHHYDMPQITDADTFSQELRLVEEAYKEITGRTMEKYYRPPQGNYTKENLAMAKELGYRTVFWSLAYADWNNDSQPTPEQAFDKLLPRTHNGAVVLLHATSTTNAAILDTLLTKWEDMGYTFAPLPQLFDRG